VPSMARMARTKARMTNSLRARPMLAFAICSPASRVEVALRIVASSNPRSRRSPGDGADGDCARSHSAWRGPHGHRLGPGEDEPASPSGIDRKAAGVIPNRCSGLHKPRQGLSQPQDLPVRRRRKRWEVGLPRDRRPVNEDVGAPWSQHAVGTRRLA
jgi:hypothetical protein